MKLVVILLIITISLLSVAPYVHCGEDYYRVTIDVYPMHTFIVVDGKTYLPTQLPVTFTWEKGSIHSVILPDTEIYKEEGTRLVFAQWNDGSKEASRVITVERDVTLIALYKTQHFLTIISPYGNPKGQEWYDEGMLANFSIDPINEIVPGKIRVVFVKWSDGLSPWSPENSIYVLRPLTITVEWKKQYWLQIDTAIEGTTVTPSGWYDEGSRVIIRAIPEFEVEKNKHKYVFDKWVNLGENLAPIEEEDNPSTSLIVDNYYWLRAEWEEYWYVKIDSDYGSPVGEGYYPEGSVVEVSVDPVVEVIPGETRMVFNGWSGSVVSDSPNLRIAVDGPKVLKAHWKKQYYLKLVSKYDEVYGSGWYDEGSVAKFYAKSSTDRGWGIKLIFDKWIGNYVGKSPEGSIVMNEPKTITASWYFDYSGLYINIAIIVSIIIVCSILTKKFILPKVYKVRTKRVSK